MTDSLSGRTLGIGHDPVNRYDGYMADPHRIVTLSLLGGHPALDFVNTLDWRDRADEEGGAVECLDSYEALLVWSRRVDLIAAGEAKTLAAKAQVAPKEAAGVLIEARRLREAIFNLVNRRPDPAALDVMNRWLAAAPARALTRKAGGYAWSAPSEPELGMPLVRLAHQAAELLTSEQLPRVHSCAGAGCGWLFIDTSPNHRRRWCSMAGCGNRAKARRHYERAKARRR